MRLDPNSPEPPYRQLAERLAAGIRSGEFPPGKPLPSLATIAHAAGVSRVTVQSALKILKSDGLVVGRQGSGVFVRIPGPPEWPEITAEHKSAATIIAYGLTLESVREWLASRLSDALTRDRLEVLAICPPADWTQPAHRRKFRTAIEQGNGKTADIESIEALTIPGVTFCLAYNLDDSDKIPDHAQWFNQEWSALCALGAKAPSSD